MTDGSRADRLIAESEKLREELLRTAARLMAFSEELTAEVQRLREAGNDAGTAGVHQRSPGTAH